ncbi:hypothetical protein OHB26_34150 [Nocardia sp. NBC_01503]|uniref:baeRF2 domain-containing protein n=1 Tax=Nocardia sp. NBC_01503 TaxID=2975997 RepID=UPI002E7B2980|nr:hypothetical protein [Nocardia sp. NBC_01503]WTL31886.1 hypothetical protein OHB26_34150 [Nocardia sp. NBC_01503]
MTRTSLRALIDRTGPFASVYFDSTDTSEDPTRGPDPRHREITEKLTAAGASEQMIGALGIAIAAGPVHTGRSGRALIADPGTVLVDEQLRAPPSREEVRVSPLPYLLPLLEQRLPRAPHVVAAVEHHGARLIGTDRNGDTVTRTVDNTAGQLPNPRDRGRPPRTARRPARDLVRHGVHRIADATDALADQVDATLIVLTGEPVARAAVRAAIESDRAESLCGDALMATARPQVPAALRRIVEVGGDRRSAAAQIDKIVTETSEAQQRTVFDRFRAARGRPSLATGGLVDTTAALRAHTVTHLLIDGAAIEHTRILRGANHTMVAIAAHELAGRAVIRRADEAIPAAGLADGSEIVPVTGEVPLPEGVGALLRPPNRSDRRDTNQEEQ